MSRSLVWDKLTPEDIDKLKNIHLIEDVQAYLLEIFDDPKRHPSWLLGRDVPGWAAKNEILMDFYFHVLRFCKEQSFTPEKTSAFFSIMYLTHTESMKQRYTHEESFKIFQQLIVHHSHHRPPFSCEVFNIADVKAIDHYVTETYYRHYKMYLYSFTDRQRLTVRTYYGVDKVEKPRIAPPLSLGIPEEEWLQQQHTQQEERPKDTEDRHQQQYQQHQGDEAVAQVAEIQGSEALGMGAPGADDDEDQEQGLDSLPLDGSLQGLKSQLEFIRSQLSKATSSKLDTIESKLSQLENKLVESDSKKDTKRKARK